ncbi:hypothetical protein ElyMa_003885400 [Elysia marginata]|uniref:Uncharacterized protein n=1 Tax=Elysia marginata TaxID=1093978 RepID=A0AAV4FME3_9GAST|nr:hypothetical protein ElyMa_003885400 [Elysia marginata]
MKYQAVWRRRLTEQRHSSTASSYPQADAVMGHKVNLLPVPAVFAALKPSGSNRPDRAPWMRNTHITVVRSIRNKMYARNMNEDIIALDRFNLGDDQTSPQGFSLRAITHLIVWSNYLTLGGLSRLL